MKSIVLSSANRQSKYCANFIGYRVRYLSSAQILNYPVTLFPRHSLAKPVKLLNSATRPVKLRALRAHSAPLETYTKRRVIDAGLPGITQQTELSSDLPARYNYWHM